MIVVCLSESLGYFSFVAIILDRPGSPPTRVAILLLCFIAGGIVTNVSLTLLIAGRIIYISKGVEGFCASSAKKKYRTVISAIIGRLESGLIYPLILVLYGSLMIPQTPQGLAVAVNILYSMVPSIMGIASTLVIVRAAVGISIQDEQSFRSTILGEEFQVPRVSGDTIDTEGEGNEVIVDLRSQGHGKVSGQECPMLFQNTQR
ncbi:hypothetical protein L218DRAFT_946969 [Marasmius fiardii PR-910]|nr:hypothetical protein L218DRAFT_946969 [Marasmius fiardii PR-910]